MFVTTMASDEQPIRYGGTESLQSTMPLNWDLIIEIMYFLARPDASRMSRTCHTLLKTAPAVLLSDQGSSGPVAISSSKAFSSFLDFMLDGRRESFRHLRHLELFSEANWHKVPCVDERLTQFFKRAKDLKSFTLCGDLLQPYQQVRSAFASMNSLRSLELAYVPVDTYEVLKTMHAPLTGVTLEFSDEEFNPILAIAPLKDSLRAVKLRSFDSLSSNAQFMHVVSLDTLFCELGHTSTIIHSFPNLQDLRVQRDDTPAYQIIQEAKQCRQMNLSSPPERPWRSLRSLIGRTIDLYMLGLRCHARNVAVSVDCLHTPQDGEMLSTVLDDVRPTSVEVHLESSEFAPTQLSRYLAPATNCLQVLSVIFGGYRHSSKNPTARFDSMIETLSTFPLRTLDICAHIGHFGLRSEDRVVRKIDLRFDVEEVAHTAMRCIPSLRFVAIDGPRPVETRNLFEICEDEVGKGGGKTLRKVPPDLADKARREFSQEEIFMKEWSMSSPWYWDL